MKSDRDEDRTEDHSTPEVGKPGHHNIASRAYFIAMEHDRHGEPHDALGDWAEAETELAGAK
jgi:hypothetical protein